MNLIMIKPIFLPLNTEEEADGSVQHSFFNFFFLFKVPYSSLLLVIVYGAFAFGSQNKGCKGKTAHDAQGEDRSWLSGPQSSQDWALSPVPLLPRASPLRTHSVLQRRH